jgi:hypothetical protein
VQGIAAGLTFPRAGCSPGLIERDAFFGRERKRWGEVVDEASI